MQAQWLIALPCWGDAYVTRFLEATLPGVKASLEFAGNPSAAFIIQTDQSHRFEEALAGYEVCYRPVPTKGDKYKQFGDAHRDAADWAPRGQRIMFLTADVMLSKEVFLACERRFIEGKKAIACCSTRTYSEVPPRPNQTAPELLDWTMENMHETIVGAFWGGKSRPPSTKYFKSEDGKHITLRCFHMHPIAVVKDRDISFKGTLDQDLFDRFATEEIHVVTDRNELSLAEMSPKHIAWHPAVKPLIEDDVAFWARRASLMPMNKWLSKHRIVIRGTGQTNDREIWDRILFLIENPPVERPQKHWKERARA